MKRVLLIAMILMTIGLVGCPPPPGYYHHRHYYYDWDRDYDDFYYDNGERHYWDHDRHPDYDRDRDRGRDHDDREHHR